MHRHWAIVIMEACKPGSMPRVAAMACACRRVSGRNEDIVCRFGGEEFVIILPEVEAMIALERAELLRQTVSDLALRYPRPCDARRG